MSAYWHDKENIGTKGSLLDLFFKYAPDESKEHAIYVFSEVLKTKKIKKKSKEWQKLKKFWKHLVENYNDKTLYRFVSWLKYLPRDENVQDLAHLIKPVALHLPQNDFFYSEKLMNFLYTNYKLCTKETLSFLWDFLDSRKSIHFPLDKRYPIEDILREGKKQSRSCVEISDYQSKIVNRLGEMGHIEFRDFLPD
jgi:hypothetical protein